MKPGFAFVCIERTVTPLLGQRSGHTKTVDIQSKGAVRTFGSITELQAIIRFVMRAPHAVRARAMNAASIARELGFRFRRSCRVMLVARRATARDAACANDSPATSTDRRNIPPDTVEVHHSTRVFFIPRDRSSEDAAGRPCLVVLPRQRRVQLFAMAEILRE